MKLLMTMAMTLKILSMMMIVMSIIIGDDDDDDDDIYIMMSVCLSVTKNHHFLLGVSCDHLNYP